MEWLVVTGLFMSWIVLCISWIVLCLWGASPREAVTESVGLAVVFLVTLLITSWICLHVIQ